MGANSDSFLPILNRRFAYFETLVLKNFQCGNADGALDHFSSFSVATNVEVACSLLIACGVDKPDAIA